MTRRVVVATRNAGKLHELRPLLAEAGFEAVDLVEAGVPPSPDEDAIEAYETFEENATAKARYFAERCGGLPVVADDSGLVVEALGGAPGVRSKRWSGRADLEGRALDAANNARLLERLAGVSDRSAAFRCAMAWSGHGLELVRTGEVRGRIVDEARGSHGFGYDPHFLADELGCTFAEADRERKAGVSHRARAARALLSAVAAAGERAGVDDRGGRG